MLSVLDRGTILSVFDILFYMTQRSMARSIIRFLFMFYAVFDQDKGLLDMGKLVVKMNDLESSDYASSERRKVITDLPFSSSKHVQSAYKTHL